MPVFPKFVNQEDRAIVGVCFLEVKELPFGVDFVIFCVVNTLDEVVFIKVCEPPKEVGHFLSAKCK